MKILKVLPMAMLVCFTAESAFSATVKYMVQQTALHYVATTEKVGSADADKNYYLVTMPNSLLLSATIDKIAIYLAPTQEGSMFGGGYYVLPALEVGANLSLAMAKGDVPKATANKFGPYATYYVEASGLQVELTYALTYMTDKSEKVELGKTTTLESSGLSNSVAAMIFVPLGKDFLYGAGASYAMDSMKAKESDVKTETTLAQVHLAAFRANF
jgi:hypothetical protein